jgi:peptidoglycan/LPS O-acetylase OafA/YrhL
MDPSDNAFVTDTAIIGQPRAKDLGWLGRDEPNALNFFRLFFAAIVIFSHSWAFGGYPTNPLRKLFTLVGDPAGNAVDGFFLISGFLITGSWLCRRNSDSYLRSRVARIWPAFAVAFIISALIAALAAGSDWLHYLRSIPKQSWFVGIFTFDPFELERKLSFAHNPYPKTVNGPMWTIRIEFSCYMAVALAGSIGALRRRWWPVTFTGLAIAIGTWEQAHLPEIAYARWARFASFFGAGSILYLFRRQVPKSGWIALFCAALLLTGNYLSLCVTLPLAGTYLIFYLAYSAPAMLKQIGTKNDISYGVYLYGGPLQQLYYSYAVKNILPMNPWICLAVALPLSVACGWASWLCIERPAKRWFK